jgi:hypothetical protein
VGKENEKVNGLTLLDIVSDYAWHEMCDLRKDGYRYVDGEVSESPCGDIDVFIRASESASGYITVGFSVTGKSEK